VCVSTEYGGWHRNSMRCAFKAPLGLLSRLRIVIAFISYYIALFFLSSEIYFLLNTQERKDEGKKPKAKINININTNINTNLGAKSFTKLHNNDEHQGEDEDGDEDWSESENANEDDVDVDVDENDNTLFSSHVHTCVHNKVSEGIHAFYISAVVLFDEGYDHTANMMAKSPRVFSHSP
jgi:hypothetical protein